MKIEFVNHASFIVDSNDVRLICDPWFEGTAFDNGWSLLAESKFTVKDFGSITHIWFSHEHPDHFSPPNISKIPPEIRKNITVLFQETLDKKVINWCKSKGFKEVIELTRDAYHSIGTDFEIMNSPYTYDDSWLFIKTQGKTILNVNDCIVDTEEQAKKIRETINSKVDILFTQFSYARFCGNKDNPESRKEGAREKIEENKVQIKVFEPEIVVPFASYVWHSHEENYYMNDEINTIDTFYEFLKTCGVSPVVLYPGDVWDVSQEHNSLESIRKYMIKYEEVFDSPVLTKTKTVPLTDIKATAKAMSEKALKVYGKLYFRTKLRKLKPLIVYLPDLDLTVAFSFLNGLEVLKTKNKFDVSMSSEAFNFGLKFDYGFGTSAVNGRLQIGSDEGYHNFNVYAGITGTINNNSFVAPNYLKLMLGKILRTLKLG